MLCAANSLLDITGSGNRETARQNAPNRHDVLNSWEELRRRRSASGPVLSSRFFAPISKPACVLVTYRNDRSDADRRLPLGRPECSRDHREARRQSEAEQVFCNEPPLMVPDVKHSVKERRIRALRRTDEGRPFHITSTLRGEEMQMQVT